MMTQPDSQRYSNTALILLNMFLTKLSPITQAEWKENNSNEDIAVNIYTLFISSIECHSRLLLAGLTRESSEHRDLYMRLIQEIINCTSKPGIYPVEESCSTLAMGFWYMLQVNNLLLKIHYSTGGRFVQLIDFHSVYLLISKTDWFNFG